MIDPGVSLFSGGAEALQLTDNQNQREEEEEALEDQRRRDQELKKLLTNAFDDLMDEEDDDDRSEVSSIQQNGFTGHHSLSNTGSVESNQNSPHYYPYTNHNHIDPQSPMSPAQVNQFDRGVFSSPVPSQPLYDANKINGFDYHHIMPHIQSTSGSNEEAPTNGYGDGEDRRNFNHMISIPQDADHFGYMSSITHADLSANENPLMKNGYSHNGNHLNEDMYRQTDLNSQDQLMVLYATRMQEISQLRKEMGLIRHERDSAVEQLKRKLLLMEAEKQGAFLSHKEAQALLSDYQTQISQLKQESEDLRLKNITLEKSKEEITRELDLAKASAVDLQQKVSILERNGKGAQSEKHVESFLKNMQQQHESQLRELNCQIESLTQRLSNKDHECCVLESKLRDAQRSQETLITEKGKIINELNKQLEDAQLKVRDYTCSSDKEETMRLRIELDQTKADRNALEEKLTDTIKKLEAAERDLRQYESVAKMGLLGNGDSSFETDSITHLGISRRHSVGGRTDKSLENSKDSTRRSTKSLRERDDLNVQLRDELHRALQGQKSKREEIRRLQGELAIRDQKIKTMKDQERIYFIEAEKFKKNLTAVLDRLKRQEEEAKALQGKNEEFSSLQNQMCILRKDKEKSEKDLQDVRCQLDQIKAENDSLREHLADMELQLDQAKVRQVDQSAAEFLAFHDESIARLRQESSRQLEAQVVDYRVRMEQAQKECEEVKRLYIEVCSAKRALLTELQEEQSRVKKVTSELEDVKEATQSLEELHKQERDLNRRLRVELDLEKSKLSKIMKDKERQMTEETSEKKSALYEELEKKLREVQAAKEKAEARADSLQKQVWTFEEDVQNLRKLEVECNELRREAIEAPKRQQAELERISRELKQSRERVIQLEKKLRAEFQSQMDVMIAERDVIQAQLKQKDIQLEEYLQALSRMRPSTREASVNTECFDRVAEVNSVRRADGEQRFIALEAQHKAAISLAEEQVKEETVRYFAEEIAKMEDKHKNELGAFAKKLVEMESTFTKHLTALKNALQLKSEEVQNLRKELQHLNLGQSLVNGNKEADDQSQLRLYVEQLKEQTESDRNKMTEALSRWANEVKELQNRESLLESKVAELKVKYKDARKAAIHYKKLSEEKDKHLKTEWNRLQSAYGESLKKVQEKVADIVSGREQEVVERLKRIESYYEGQMKDLESRLKREAVIS